MILNIPCLALEKGSALVILGANGSGKSTLLRILAFLEEPSAGSLTLYCEGEPRRNCTLLLQEPWLLRASVFSNVTLGLKLRGKYGNLQPMYREAMQAAGFENPDSYASRQPHSLSGGEKQRVALAARLILQPAILLLDEPTAHVDARSGSHIAKALGKAREKGATIVCSTHDENLVEALSAKTLLLRKPDQNGGFSI